MLPKRRKATMWQVYGRRDGKKIYVGTYASEIEAKAAERRYAVTQEQIAAGELPAELDLDRTVKQATEEWLASLKASGSRSHGGYTDRAQRIIANTPMGRFGSADELNGAVQWLCSDAASFVTGAVIPVDGGFSVFSGV